MCNFATLAVQSIRNASSLLHVNFRSISCFYKISLLSYTISRFSVTDFLLRTGAYPWRFCPRWAAGARGPPSSGRRCADVPECRESGAQEASPAAGRGNEAGGSLTRRRRGGPSGRWSAGSEDPPLASALWDRVCQRWWRAQRGRRRRKRRASCDEGSERTLKWSRSSPRSPGRTELCEARLRCRTPASAGQGPSFRK